MRLVLGTCHHDCPDSCGWQVTVDDDGRATQLRGNPAHPYSAGELCPKVNRYLGRVYSDERVLTPLRRVGAKGEGRFEPISWDDALDEIATRFHAIIREHGPEAIVPFVSAGNQSLLALMFGDRLWHHLGVSRVTGGLCGLVANAGTATTMGTGKGMDPSDVRHSRFIILWGTNTKLTNRHLWPFVEQARANGATVVVIDPIRTATAEAADWFLQPLPGTDVALSHALLHAVIERGWTAPAFITGHTTGFDTLQALVGVWTPARAAEVCGLAEADIW